jgi:hypothetical protein
MAGVIGFASTMQAHKSGTAMPRHPDIALRPAGE